MAENKRDYYEVLGVEKGASAEEITPELAGGFITTVLPGWF